MDGGAGAVTAAMNVVSVLPPFLEQFREIVEELPKLLNSLNDLTKAIGSTVDGILTDFNAMKKAKLKLESKSKTVFHDLSSTGENALLFVEVVCNLLWYGGDETTMAEIQQGIDSNDYTPLTAFMSQIQHYMYQVGVTYGIFTASCCEASKSSTDAAETCKYNAIQQRSRNVAAKVIGGGTTVAAGSAVAIVGTGISVAAGPPTGGIGTVLGLTITAAAFGVTTATSAIVTHLIAKDFEKLEKEFRKLGTVFDQLANKADSMNETVETLNMKVTLISSCIDSVEHSWKNTESATCLKTSLNLLYKRFGELHKQSTSCRESVQRQQHELKSCFKTLCPNQ